jgi:hypothetical protein
MGQGLLPFEYRQESRKAGGTAMAGMPLLLELACATGLWASVRYHVDVCSENQGWTDEQIVLALVMLNLAGGDCVDDLRILESDEGFCRVWAMAEGRHLSPAERAAQEERFRRERTRTLPSPSSVFRFLAGFANREEEAKRGQGKAFIPAPSAALSGLRAVNKELVGSLQAVSPARVATLDMDATLVETFKKDALYSYKGYPAYQPMNVYWAEQGVILHSEFRDGNVPAGHEQKRVLEETLTQLPEGVERVYLRSDTAGYQWELLHYCGRGEAARFGRIGFAVGCDITEEFRKAARAVPPGGWRPVMREIAGVAMPSGREWAEVCYVPGQSARRKDDPDYRFIAIREVLAQQSLPQMQSSLPFPTAEFEGDGVLKTYKLHGLVTNLDWEGGKIVGWLNARCGKSEEVHSIQKEDLAGGTLPSSSFGENAAWWLIMVLAFNLAAILKRQVLGEGWATKRMKAIRFGLLNLPGSFVMHANRTWLKVSVDAQTFGTLVSAREKIAALWRPPRA